MSSKARDVPLLPDFESAEWDEPEVCHEEAISAALEAVLEGVDAHIGTLAACQRVVARVMDSSLDAAMSAVDTLRLPREGECALQPAALVYGSWEAEAEPTPAAPDAWLRAAVPEAVEQQPLGLEADFVRPSGGVGRGSSSGPGDRRLSDPAAPVLSSRCPYSGQQPAAAAADLIAEAAAGGSRGSPGVEQGRGSAGGGVGGQRSRVLQPSPPIAGALAATKDEPAVAEDRLRDELSTRNSQMALAARLEAKDVECKAQLALLGRTLKGKDYAYDHQGRITPLVASKANGAGRLSAGVDFRLYASPPAHPRSSSHMNAAAAAPSQDMGPPRHPAPIGADKPERKLTNDFREAPSRSQPSAMDSMLLGQNVILRQGAATKAGVPRAMGGKPARQARQQPALAPVAGACAP